MIAGILLAAGTGTRFGGRKLLHHLADGTPIGLSSLRHLRAGVSKIVAVLRPDDAEVQALFAGEGVEIIQCADADKGMGHSLAAGIAQLAEADGWVVALGDMPCIRAETVRAIASELERRAGIVVPVFRGERGHPVGFAHNYREELLALSGDAGARPLLQRHAAQVYRLEVDDPGILQDVDTPADAQRIGCAPPPSAI